jgi:hypothetical protein
LESQSGHVRLAAHDALRFVTNHKIKGRIKATSSKRRWRRIHQAWTTFGGSHKKGTWLGWMKAGFEQRGYRFKKGGLDKDAIPVLIRAIANRDYAVSYNAVYTLGVLTQHHVEPRWRSRRNNARHWRYWVKKNVSAQTGKTD